MKELYQDEVQTMPMCFCACLFDTEDGFDYCDDNGDDLYKYHNANDENCFPDLTPFHPKV